MSAGESSQAGKPPVVAPASSDQVRNPSSREVAAASDANAQDSEVRYRELFESTGDAIMLLGATGFIECNQATLQSVWLSLEAGVHRASSQ